MYTTLSSATKFPPCCFPRVLGVGKGRIHFLHRTYSALSALCTPVSETWHRPHRLRTPLRSVPVLAVFVSVSHASPQKSTPDCGIPLLHNLYTSLRFCSCRRLRFIFKNLYSPPDSPASSSPLYLSPSLAKRLFLSPGTSRVSIQPASNKQRLPLPTQTILLLHFYASHLHNDASRQACLRCLPSSQGQV